MAYLSWLFFLLFFVVVVEDKGLVLAYFYVFLACLACCLRVWLLRKSLSNRLSKRMSWSNGALVQCDRMDEVLTFLANDPTVGNGCRTTVRGFMKQEQKDEAPDPHIQEILPSGSLPSVTTSCAMATVSPRR